MDEYFEMLNHQSQYVKLTREDPFFLNRITNAIKRCLVQAQPDHDVILVNIPRDNIEKQLDRNWWYDKLCISHICVICSYGKLGDCASLELFIKLNAKAVTSCT